MAQNRAYINKTLAFICSQIGVSISCAARYKEEQIRSWLDETNDDLPTFTQLNVSQGITNPFCWIVYRKENVPVEASFIS